MLLGIVWLLKVATIYTLSITKYVAIATYVTKTCIAMCMFSCNTIIKTHGMGAQPPNAYCD